MMTPNKKTIASADMMCDICIRSRSKEKGSRWCEDEDGKDKKREMGVKWRFRKEE